MRFVVDAQPSALARRLEALGHTAEHVADRGMAFASDDVIRDYACWVGAVIVTKDEDFAIRRLLAEACRCVAPIWQQPSCRAARPRGSRTAGHRRCTRAGRDAHRDRLVSGDRLERSLPRSREMTRSVPEIARGLIEGQCLSLRASRDRQTARSRGPWWSSSRARRPCRPGTNRSRSNPPDRWSPYSRNTRPRELVVAALTRRIVEAARYVPLERLCLSPQCGFSSLVRGNEITEADQWAKLERLVEVTRQVWK